MTAWNDFVKKIYHEGHNKNSSYSFKQALQDASKRKGEMGTATSMKNPSKKMRKSRKSTIKGGKKTRKHRRKRH